MKKLYYYQNEFNFGDILSLYIVQYIMGVEVQAGNESDSNIVAIGSLLQTLVTNKPHWLNALKKPIYVWGTGFISPEKAGYTSLIRPVRVCAVRGKLTLERLQKYVKNLEIKNIALGDPGLLASKLIDTTNIEKKYDLGIIPHYVDKNNVLLDNIRVKNSVIIDIQQSPEDFLSQVAQCKNIISSAMHGLIAADSLGIPNVRMVLSDKIVGGDYKYNDYYSAFGITEHRKIELKSCTITDKDLHNIASEYQITCQHVQQICDNLIKSFPYRRMV